MRLFPALIFAFSFCIFAIMVGTTSIQSLKIERNSASSDDALSWLLKAPQMLECPQGDCRFLVDIRKQTWTSESELNQELNFKRWREAHCLLDVYTPLYTAALIGIRSLFNSSWEWSYYILSLASTLFVIGSLASFLLIIFGATSAAWGLLLLSTTPWGYMKWAAPTPTNITMATFFFTCTILYAKPRIMTWLCPVFILMMAGLHPMGRLLAVIIAMLYTYQHWPCILNRKAALYSLLASTAILITAFALPALDTPLRLNLIQWSYPDIKDQINHVAESFGFMLRSLHNSLHPALDWLLFGWPVGGVIYIGALFILTNRLQKNRGFVAILQIGLILLALASHFHMMRGYPGELFARVYTALLIPVAGCFGLACTETMPKIGRLIYSKLQRAFVDTSQ